MVTTQTSGLVRAAGVEYRQLGKSGLRISVPVLGMMGMGLSNWMPWVLDEDRALPILKAAYDRGVNTWDTANVYSNGVSETIAGKAMIQYKIPRHKLVLMTKVFGYVREDTSIRGATLYPSTIDKNMGNTYGLSRTAILNAVDASLQRLQTDYIDLLMIHRFDKNVPIEETMRALHDLVTSGKVRYIGASSMWTHEFALMQFAAEANGWTKFISMQNYQNLLYREEEREMNKFCDLTGVGRMAWAPLGQGRLTNRISERNSARGASQPPISSPADIGIISRVEELAEKKGWPMSHVALAWISNRVTSPVVGFSSIERLDDILEAGGKTLTKEEEEYLEEPYLPRAIIGHT
ncbi:hypothetical protein NQ176_g6356 [Zarea fungicola]|uniref:Uncharacterized protein n=1 Tax=Zarea fungicola TaxID=93591 RepID=A0ACC1N3L8_9HYPO|nr:hypothetical protein NQ176_g6356 [Lecanicillium fungicola]